MALCTLSKVRLYTHSSCTRQVLEFLQEKESFDLIASKDQLIGTKSEYIKADLGFAIKFLSPYAKPASGVRALFLGDRIEISEAQAKKMVSSSDFKGVIRKTRELEVERNDFTRSLFDISSEIDVLSGWEEVEVCYDSRFISSFFRVHKKDVNQFEAQVLAITNYLDLSRVTERGSEVYYSVIISKEDIVSVREILQKVKGEEISLPEGSVKDRIACLRKEKKAKESKLKDLDSEVIVLAGKINELKACYDFYSSAEGIEGAMGIPQESSSISILEGWMVKNEIASLKAEMESSWPGVEVEEVSLEEGEKSPVCIRNNSAIEPFSVVTGMYGAPKASEIDPTPFLAPFFVIFFGLCLTDAAYGMILAIAMAAVLIAKMPLEKGVRNMVTLLLYSGVSTVFFGVLFGGWFGIDPSSSAVPSFLTYASSTGDTLFLGQIFQPAKDLVGKIAPLVLLLGVLHLLLGVALNGYISWKNGKPWDAFMVAIPTFVTVSLGILLSLSLSEVIPASLASVLQTAIIASFVIMTIGIMKSGGPIEWFMGVTGWLSNTLSYARLFALGLATGVVAQVFNSVAFTIGNMMPTGVDILVIVVIILFGHTLNVALNLLGAFVHSGRLQFVEFFGQFLEGGGRYFAPLKKTNRYIHNS